MRFAQRHSLVVAPLAATAFILAACNALSGASDFETERDEDAVLPEAQSESGSPSVVVPEAGSDSPSSKPDSAPSDVDSGPLTKLVFVTSARPSGAIGGLDGADALCREAAATGGLGSSQWVAWLSTSTVNAISRIKHAGRYAMLDGRVVVSNKAQLASGTIEVPINVTEMGAVAESSAEEARVWTGTRTDGNSTPPDLCSDWTTSNSLAWGVMGSIKSSAGAWTRAPGVVEVSGGWGCQTKGHIYCFEL